MPVLELSSSQIRARAKKNMASSQTMGNNSVKNLSS
jgi:hypothetical protein